MDAVRSALAVHRSRVTELLRAWDKDVDTVDFTSRPFVITSSERTVYAHSVILATGATAKRLRIPSEDEFWSKGISACAICDGPDVVYGVEPWVEE